MRGFLSRGAAAARLAGDRADLWPAGALASLVFVGWLTILLVLAPPNPDSFAYLAISLVTSSLFPVNVVLLSVALVAGIVLLCLLAGLAEASLQRAAWRTPGSPPLGRSLLTGLALILLAALPVVLAIVALLLGVIGVGPSEFQSPDVSTPVLVRMAGELWPLLGLVALALLLGQAFGGVALRLAIGPRQRSLGEAMRGAILRLRRRPGPLAGVALGGVLLDLLAAVLTYALLRLLWAPIGDGLQAGQLLAPQTLLLLVGFIAIWLALLLAAGALHVTISAWWALELSAAPSGG